LHEWHVIWFRQPVGEHFCAVFSFKDSVKLYFGYGAHLKGPDGILEENTKQVLNITFKKINDIQEKFLKRLVQQAVLYLTNRK
jgi:hypothetical protein